MKNTLLEKETLKKSLIWSSRIFILMLMLLAMLQSVARAQTYQDSTFNNSGWTSTVLWTSPGATFTSGQDTVNGNPAQSRTTSHVGTTGGIHVAHLNATAIYDPPVEGAIVNLSYSYDLINYTASTNFNFGFAIIVFQNNTYYSSNPPNEAFINSWTSYGLSNLTAASFVKLSGPSPNNNPDFSCKGAKIQFGYLSWNGNHTATALKGGIDNWKVNIDKTNPCCGTIYKQKVTCNKKGVFTYTFDVTNNSTQQVQYVLVSPPAGATYTVTPNIIALGSTPLGPGQTTSVTVTINNASSGTTVCLNVILVSPFSKTKETCCSVEVCLKLPTCSPPKVKTDNGMQTGMRVVFWTQNWGEQLFESLTGVQYRAFLAADTPPTVLRFVNAGLN